MVKNVNNIFKKAALISNLKKKVNSQKKIKAETWFDKDCKEIRQKLRKLSNQKHRDQQNPDLRFAYFDTLKHYKHSLRTKKEQHKRAQLTKIEESINSNKFWEN